MNTEWNRDEMNGSIHHQITHQVKGHNPESKPPLARFQLHTHLPDPAPATWLHERGQEEPCSEQAAVSIVEENTKEKWVPRQKQERERERERGRDGCYLSLGEEVQLLLNPKSRGGFKLTDRDVEILKWLSDMQCLTMGQLAHQFFGSTPQIAHRRTNILIEQRLLRHETIISANGVHRLIRIAPKGLAVLEERGIESIPQKRKLTSSTITHDLLISDVRHQLSQFWDFDWIPESSLKSAGEEEIPDGVCHFPTTGNQIAIEVENTLKSSKRYESIFARWRTRPIYLVLYVATQPSIIRGLQNQMSGAPGDIPLALISLDDFKSSAPTAWSARGELDLFSERVI